MGLPTNYREFTCVKLEVEGLWGACTKRQADVVELFVAVSQLNDG